MGSSFINGLPTLNNKSYISSRIDEVIDESWELKNEKKIQNSKRKNYVDINVNQTCYTNEFINDKKVFLIIYVYSFLVSQRKSLKTHQVEKYQNTWIRTSSNFQLLSNLTPQWSEVNMVKSLSSKLQGHSRNSMCIKAVPNSQYSINTI